MLQAKLAAGPGVQLGTVLFSSATVVKGLELFLTKHERSFFLLDLKGKYFHMIVVCICISIHVY